MQTGTIRTTFGGPRVHLDDGRILKVDYDLLDACHLSERDRVRARISHRGEVVGLDPLLTVDEAVRVLQEAKVLSSSASAPGGSDLWPLVVLDLIGEETSDAVFLHDIEHLEIDDARRWLRASGSSVMKVEAGPSNTSGEPALVLHGPSGPMAPVRAVAHEFVDPLNEALAERDDRFRWYLIEPIDPRTGFLRLDRPT